MDTKQRDQSSKILFEQYLQLDIEAEWIGLKRCPHRNWFCTPIGATIIGWENAIHYCFIDKFGNVVFAVNPETCCQYYVYPIAYHFYDFLSMILTVGHAATLEQTILWSKEEYYAFESDPRNVKYCMRNEVQSILNLIKTQLHIMPNKDPFAYIKNIQSSFDYSQIPFSKDFYENYLPLPTPPCK